MNIFKKFKVTFNLKTPNKKTKDKDKGEIQCLKYRIYSEFTTDHVFDTNPRHFQEKPFTPTQSKKLQVKSLSENNLSFNSFATDRTDEEKTEKKEVQNIIWPPKIEITEPTEDNKTTNIQHRLSLVETTRIIEEKEDEKQTIPQPRKEKGILKNKNEQGNVVKMNSEQNEIFNENNFSRTNFGFEAEDITYEHYETIDDQLGEEDIYYFEHKGNENADEYVVHKSTTVHFDESEHEYEEPLHERKNKEENNVNPTYNLSTHPKLNPSFQDINDEEYAKSIGLNTFGNTHKLKYPSDYSLEAASIFFDTENDYEC